MRALDAAIAAQERAQLAARRTFWAPEISFDAELNYDFSRSGAGSDNPVLALPVNRWSVALFARLPLYAGGRRRAEVRQTSEVLSGLRLDRESLAQQIEERIRVALFAASSTFAAIGLSAEAAAAAERNLELVTDSYSRGVVSIIDLLDAQNQALVAKEFAVNAVFDFLIDLMEVERATSTFDFFASEEGRRAWLNRLAEYYAARGKTVRERRR